MHDQDEEDDVFLIDEGNDEFENQGNIVYRLFNVCSISNLNFTIEYHTCYCHKYLM